MNKDYHNKFALNIWCSFADIIPCILTFLFLFKDDIAKIGQLYFCNFRQSQKTKLSNVTFIHRINFILFVTMMAKKSQIL